MNKFPIPNFQFPISKCGFTLIEILIAISIAMIAIGGGVVSYNTFNQRQIIKTNALEVKSLLRSAQSKALSGEKPVDIVCTVLNGYIVSVTENSISTYAQCSDGNSTPETVNLPTDLTFSSPPSPFLFKVLGEGVSRQADIMLSGYNKVYEFAISPTGEVQDKGFVNATEVQSTSTPVNQPSSTPTHGGKR